MSAYTVPQRRLDLPLQIGIFYPDGRYGVPNSLREVLLQQGFGDVSLLLDALLNCGYTPNRRFTFRQVLAHLREKGFQLGRGLIRRALKSGLFKLAALQNGRRGRPELLYFMPDIAALVQQMAGGAWVAVDSLDVADLQSLTRYRQALHCAFIRRAPGIYSRAFLAARLGVSRRCTYNYDRLLGIRAIRRLLKQNLRFYSDWREMIQMGKRGLNWLLVEWSDGRSLEMPLRERLAEGYLWKEGVTVSFVTQLCNRYVYAPDDDWGDLMLLYQHDDERSIPGNDRYQRRSERLAVDPVSATLNVDANAYKPYRPPLPAWLPPEMAARRTVRNPFVPERVR
jgi:hypothetical protein